MKVIVDEKKIVFEAEKDETLSLSEASNGEIFVWYVRTQRLNEEALARRIRQGKKINKLLIDKRS
jgi:hypothetical protein